MPCMNQPDETPAAKAEKVDALKRLLASLELGTVKVVVGKTGSLAFSGWAASERRGLSDLCAYRAIANAPAMRKALVRAEAMSGNRMDPRAIASGLHSHDGGTTWSRH